MGFFSMTKDARDPEVAAWIASILSQIFLWLIGREWTFHFMINRKTPAQREQNLHISQQNLQSMLDFKIAAFQCKCFLHIQVGL